MLRAVSSPIHGLIKENESPYAWQWYFKEIDVNLMVPKSAFKVFDGNRQFGNKNECGGLLFAHENHRDGVVLGLVTPPNPKDKSTRHSLDFDPERCRIETKAANQQGYRLIGYWHSHPEDIPNLSSQDMQTFRKLIKENPIELPSPIAVIVGRNKGPEGIRAWQIKNNAIIKAEFRLITKE